MFKAKASVSAFIPSLSGHSMSVEAGNIYTFPDAMKTEAILAGCIPVEDEVSQPIVDNREALIYEAVADLILRNDSRELLPEGYPRIASVKKRLGFSPEMSEIMAAADKFAEQGKNESI